MTEGGYDLPALHACLEAMLAVASQRTAEREVEDVAGPAPRGERAVAAVRAAQAPFWRGI